MAHAPRRPPAPGLPQFAPASNPPPPCPRISEELLLLRLREQVSKLEGKLAQEAAAHAQVQAALAAAEAQIRKLRRAGGGARSARSRQPRWKHCREADELLERRGGPPAWPGARLLRLECNVAPARPPKTSFRAGSRRKGRLQG